MSQDPNNLHYVLRSSPAVDEPDRHHMRGVRLQCVRLSGDLFRFCRLDRHYRGGDSGRPVRVPRQGEGRPAAATQPRGKPAV